MHEDQKLQLLKSPEYRPDDIYGMLFPNISIPKFPELQRNINHLILRFDELFSMQMSARNVEEISKVGMVQRLDLDDFLMSTLPIYLKGKQPQQIPMPNNTAILQELRKNEHMTGAIKHNFLGPMDLADKFLRALGATVVKDVHGDMKITTVGVADENNKPTALVHFYHGGGGRGRHSRIIAPVSNPEMI